MQKTFEYQGIDGRYRPIIPITLRLGSKELTYAGLIDSGADFNIFHSNVAKILGIDMKKLKSSISFKGIGGQQAKGYYTTVDIAINGHYIKTPVIFSSAIGETAFGVLGQQGFFDKYDIRFEYRKKKIIIEG